MVDERLRRCSSMSEVSSFAASASVRATISVGDAHDVGGKSRRVEVADMRAGRDQHLAAEMAAFLFRSELVLEVDAGGARLDIGLHDLEGVERPAEAGFGIGKDRREPGIDRKALAFGRLDLVGALQRSVDAPREFRAGIGGIKRLVGIHRRRRCWRRRRPASRRDRLPSGRRGPAASPDCLSSRRAR